MRLVKRIARGREHQHWAEAFMATFIMLTRLSHGALKSPEELEKLERKVVDRITAEIPEVEWSASYATLGPYDYVDIFQALTQKPGLRQIGRGSRKSPVTFSL
jgi:uncharacterized protein with GYD domain